MSSLMPTQGPPSALSQAMTANFDNPVAADDHAPAGRAGNAAPRGGAGVHGTFSIETFCSAGGLSLTHEDADGFRNYLAQWHVPNFIYRDAGVKVWAYYEDFDNWQDTYGMDAAMCVYHSGHGGMDGNGVFYVPMGADWGGLGCTATSDRMRLGNERARYVFWSTCLSLRIAGGHNPIRTWQAANLGFRMLFGFETVSWDNPNYGKFFWEEWNKNKSLSTAWLDASWRIAHDQAPSVVACGATQQEAQSRLYNERSLQWGQASRNWWWWRWYNAASAARSGQRSLPRQAMRAMLAPVDARQAAMAADRLGFSARSLASRADGSFALHDGGRSLTLDPRGGFNLELGQPNRDNQTALALHEARRVALDAIGQHGLAGGAELVFDRALHSSAAGGTLEGSGRIEKNHVTETVLQYRQVIDGLPVISPDAGTVRVRVDNDGRVTAISSSLREVRELSRDTHRMQAQPNDPTQSGPVEPLPAGDDIDALLAPEVGRRLRSVVSRGGTLLGVSEVPGTAEIGYDMQGDSAELVARKGIEIDFGGGYKKRYWVQAPVPV